MLKVQFNANSASLILGLQSLSQIEHQIKMVAKRRKKYQTGEASNFVTRKQALGKLQLNLKVSLLSIQIK